MALCHRGSPCVTQSCAVRPEVVQRVLYGVVLDRRRNDVLYPVGVQAAGQNGIVGFRTTRSKDDLTGRTV